MQNVRLVAAAKALNATTEGLTRARNAANKATNNVKNSFTKASTVPIGSLPFGDPKDNIVKSPDGRLFQKKRWHWYDVAASWKEIPANAPVATSLAIRAPAANSVAAPMANSVAAPMTTQTAGTRKNRSLKKKSRKNRKNRK